MFLSCTYTNIYFSVATAQGSCAEYMQGQPNIDGGKMQNNPVCCAIVNAQAAKINPEHFTTASATAHHRHSHSTLAATVLNGPDLYART